MNNHEGARTTRLFGMDTSFFHAPDTYTMATRFEMLAELGYDGITITADPSMDSNCLADLSRLSDEHGIEIVSVYLDAPFDFNGIVPRSRRRLKLLLDEAPSKRIEICISNPTDHASSPMAAEQLLVQHLWETADEVGVSGKQLLLYPHAGAVVEHAEHAAQLWAKVDHPSLGITFSAYHWFVTDGTDIETAFNTVRPGLQLVNICGLVGAPGMGTAGIAPLDTGNVDLFGLLGHLKGSNYDGWIGIQGWSVGGDPYNRLQRSKSTYKDIERRLTSHPHWIRTNAKRPTTPGLADKTKAEK